MPSVSIVTPWLGHLELLPAYAAAVEHADQVVIVQNGSPEDDQEFFDRGWTPVKDSAMPLGFAASNNLGAEFAAGDIVVYLNNDVTGDPGWIDMVREQVTDGALYGPSVGDTSRIGRYVDGALVWCGINLPDGSGIPYVEGWCVAATRETWERVGPWDAERFPKPYWEDVELSIRAIRSGCEIRRTHWPITHLGGTTTSTTPGAWDGWDAQRQIVEDMMREAAAA